MYIDVNILFSHKPFPPPDFANFSHIYSQEEQQLISRGPVLQAGESVQILRVHKLVGRRMRGLRGWGGRGIVYIYLWEVLFVLWWYRFLVHIKIYCTRYSLKIKFLFRKTKYFFPPLPRRQKSWQKDLTVHSYCNADNIVGLLQRYH